MTELWDPSLADDLERFVLFVYPWGKAGTPLENFKGPRTWQRDELQKITEHIRNNKLLIKAHKDPLIYQSATASGRGVGKSSLVAWINHWMMTTRLGSTCINTANTEDQLKSKTWAEMGKWHTLSINSHWFERTALSLLPANWFQDSLKKQLQVDTGYYYSKAVLWSEENPDSFAGAHNHNGILLVFDEASGIPKPIWSVSEGFFTEPILHRYWFVFSNPRRNTGSFFECFHGQRAFWKRRNLDSRYVEGTDKTVLNQIISKYGDDSDEARIEVKGEFPRQGDSQFISRETIVNAVQREMFQDGFAPLIMGVDPARFGDDSTVIRFRQGRDARSIPAIKLKGKDNMAVTNMCAHLIQKYNPDAVCIDAGGGSGIIDRLKELKYKVHEISFGSSPEDPKWSNKRTELWARLRDWLEFGCIDSDSDLLEDLAGPQFDFKGPSDKIRLEPKEDMKARGLSSPDDADALALTFAVRVANRELRSVRAQANRRVAKDVDYKILG